MKRTLTLLGVLIGTGVVAMAAGQGAQGPPPGRGQGMGPGQGMGQGQGMRMGGPARMKAELGLTDEQEAQLRKLHLDQRKAQIRRRADLQVARMDLQELLAAKTVDDKAIAVKVKEITDLSAGGLKAHVDSQLALRKVLTPEQLEKMKQLHNRPGPPQMRGRRGPRRGEGPEPGDEGLPGDDGEAEASTPGEGR